MDCFDEERGICITLFLIFGAWDIGTPIYPLTPHLYNIWFYSCCFSNRTDCCSAGFSLYFNTVHLSHVPVPFCLFFHKYHPVASALSDFIHSVPNSEKHLRVVGLLLPSHHSLFSHHSTCPMQLGKSLISLLHTYLQHLPGTSIFVYLAHS